MFPLLPLLMKARSRIHKLRQRVAFHSCSLASQESGILLCSQSVDSKYFRGRSGMLHQRFDNTLFDKHMGFQFVYEIEFKDV